MPIFQQPPFFRAVIWLIAIVAAGEGGCLVEQLLALRAAEKKLVQQQHTLAGVAATVPSPSVETSEQIEADLVRAERALATTQAELRDWASAVESRVSAKPPATRTDAFFDLATWREKTRSRATKQGFVIAPAAAHFGFSSYAGEGPESALIAPVFRQRLMVEFMVDALIEAHAWSLVSVQRERPVSADERKIHAEAAAVGAIENESGTAPFHSDEFTANADDFFIPDPRLCVRLNPFVEATAIRVSFTGQTSALRILLNTFARFEQPLIVRSVEIEPASGDELTGEGGRETSVPETHLEGLAPLVPKTISKFTVLVECIELVSPAGTSSASVRVASVSP